jgi:hypothetical protein
VAPVSLSRVRAGEWLIGLAALALLVILFALPWYGFESVYAHNAAALGQRVQFSGWQSLAVIRVLVLILVAGGLTAFYLQARCVAPAIPVCAVVLETAFGLVVVVALVYRVLINIPNVHLLQADYGAYIALALAVAIVVGGYISMRQDRAPAPGTVVPIEYLRVAARPAGR